jgi:starch phosphorylase
MKLKKLEEYADNKDFSDKFDKIKRNNKKKLAEYIRNTTGIIVSEDSIFDVQAKRLHEYKRQLMNIIRILYNYIEIIEDPDKYREARPITCIFAAKAAPGYNRAKTIIKLINDVANLVNNDTRIMDKIKVVFLENYSVSLAQMIFPASDISEQISTASKEASGTGNMKFMLNGALTLGTLDGANVEIHESVGDENIYIFGFDSKTVQQIYETGLYDPRIYLNEDPKLKKALDMLIDGSINSERLNLYKEIYDSLLSCRSSMSDQYLIMGDFKSYKETHDKMVADYEDRNSWNKKAIINVANAGRFSSDISIANYNKRIWKLK